MRPARTYCEALEQWWHLHRRDIPLQHEVKPHQMDAHGLVWVLAAAVLNCVGVHRQLVDLSEENRILELAG